MSILISRQRCDRRGPNSTVPGAGPGTASGEARNLSGPTVQPARGPVVSADSLDELIAPGWATDGQRNTPGQPETANDATGGDLQSHAENGDQPQTAATPEPAS